MKDARLFANYQRAAGRPGMVFLAEVGSTMLGLKQEDKSDRDEMGVCIESPKDLLGFAPFEHDIYRTAEDRSGRHGEPSGPGDIDLTVYGLRKFVRMALSGNPNVISLLYLPQKHFSVYTNLAAELQGLASKFASKEVGKAFLGYLKAQRLRLMGQKGQKNVNRDELEAAHGYDTKYAMHMLRLGMQGYYFVRNGKLKFPLDSSQLGLLQQVRRGEHSLTTVLQHALEYESAMLNHMEDSAIKLHEKPDYATIEKWLVDTYKREWYEKEAAPQQQGPSPDTEGKDSGAGKGDGETIEAEIRF